MKKILVYYDSMHRKGGVERVIANLFNELVNYYNVTILTCDNKQSAYNLDNRIELITMMRDRTLNMQKSKFFRMIQIINSLKYNHTFLKKIYNEYDYIYVATPLTSLEVFLLGKKARLKLVVAEHASYFACNSVYKLIRKIVYPHIYCLSVPTKTDTNIYLNNKCPAIYIPHLSTYKQTKEKQEINKVALNIGRFTSDKQQMDLIRIWWELKNRNKLHGWVLKIVGDGELKQDLIKLIESLNLENEVIIKNSTPKIEEIYKEADLFLFTSRLEGFGMVLFEAMAFGLPCVSYDCDSGPRDIIINGKNGYLIEMGNKEEFIRKTSQLIIDNDTRRKLSVGALQTINEWDNNGIIIQWKNIFR